MTNPALELDVGAHIQRALAVIHPEVSKFTYPLFASDDRGRPELYGSSVLLECDGQTVLLTAAHAVYEITRTGSAVYIGAQHIVQLPTNFIRTSEAGQDPMDLAALVLPEELLIAESMLALPLSNVLLESPASSPHIRCIHGYPLTKNTTRKRADEARHVFTKYGLTYAGASRDIVVDYARFKKDEDVHVALRYQRESKNEGGEQVVPPSPKGISGGGLWSVPDSYHPQTFFLDGIAIEIRDKSLVFATRSEHAVNFIRRAVLPQH